MNTTRAQRRQLEHNNAKLPERQATEAGDSRMTPTERRALLPWDAELADAYEDWT